MVSAWWSSWFPKENTTQQLVQDLDNGLVLNSRRVDDFIRLKERLILAFEIDKKTNPALFEPFEKPSDEVLSEKEMAHQLALVMGAAEIDLLKVRQDLQSVQKRRELLEKLLTVLLQIESKLNSTLEIKRQAIALDTQNVQNLNGLRKGVQNAGLTPTCHTDSMV